MYLDLIEAPRIFTLDVVRKLISSDRKRKVQCPFTAEQLVAVLCRAESRHRSLSELIDKRALQAEVKNLERLHRQTRKMLQIWKQFDAQTRHEIGHGEPSNRPYRYVVDTPPHAKATRIVDRVSDFATSLIDGSRACIDARKFKSDGRPECSPALLAFIQIIHDAWIERTGSPETFGAEFRRNIEDTHWEPVSPAAELIVSAVALLHAGYQNSEIRTAIKYAKRLSKNSKASRTK